MISLVSPAPPNRQSNRWGEGRGRGDGRNKEGTNRSTRSALPFIRSISSCSRLMNDESDEKKVNYRAHIYERPRRGPKETGRSLRGIQINGTTYHS